MTKISRSKIELSLECPRCFWLDVKKSVKRPPPAPYTINNAIDWLLKQEFDIYRAKGEPHPIMIKNKVEAIPFDHPNLNTWRHNFTGVQASHKPTDFLVFGAVDDVWINPKKELIVVDYKATGANQHQIYDSYKRQMEIYQWLLRGNDFPVAEIGYFVFAKTNKAEGFGHGTAALSFDIFVEPQKGDVSWIETALQNARKIYDSETAPESSKECIYCTYRKEANDAQSAPKYGLFA